jgi:4a-hydroxytetrahydrobiopterin dehydratase
MGDRWLSVTDEYHRRRIDSTEDWVHQEILSAFQAEKPVLPVRFDGLPALRPEALPQGIQKLAGVQSVEIRESDWNYDIDSLLRRLTDFGFDRPNHPVRYPTPVITEPVATDAEINEFLRRYPSWSIQHRRHPTDARAQRRGIGTTLDFRSFRDAIHFMNTASWGIDERHHHPEWENIWKSVVIWITQFDIGGDITGRNIELAEYLMAVYEPYSKVAH